MRTCPSCGVPAKHGEKFCGQCGSPLGPELPGTEPGPAAPLSPGGLAPWQKILIAGAVILIIILAIAAGYFLMKGPGTTPTGAGAVNASAGSGSYVIVATEELTAAPTTGIPSPVPATPSISPTAVLTKKPLICAADRLMCDTVCVDAKTDSNHCGTCGTTCPQGEACVNGNCMIACPYGQTSCQEGCFNLLTDANHCGSCLNNCPAGLVCRNGQCSPPPTTIYSSI